MPTNKIDLQLIKLHLEASDYVSLGIGIAMSFTAFPFQKIDAHDGCVLFKRCHFNAVYNHSGSFAICIWSSNLA